MNNIDKYVINESKSIKDALVKLNNIGLDVIQFVVDDSGNLLGSLTDGDIRRGLIEGLSLEDLVISFINKNPKYLRRGQEQIQKITEYKRNNFKVIPVLDADTDKIVKIVNFRILKSYLPLDAVIMAGGEGHRLRPLTENTPKPLLPVGSKPIIEHNIDRLIEYGIDDFHVTVKYLGDQIVNHFEANPKVDTDMKFYNETAPLGTIGSLSNITELGHDYVLLTNSDLLTNLDYESFFLDFIEKKADMSVVSIPYSVDIPYAVLDLEGDDVKNLKEKPTYTYYSNGGIYLIRKELISLIPQDEIYNATDFMERLIELDKKVISYRMAGYWLDIGKHDDYEKAQKDIANIRF